MPRPHRLVSMTLVRHIVVRPDVAPEDAATLVRRCRLRELALGAACAAVAVGVAAVVFSGWWLVRHSWSTTPFIITVFVLSLMLVFAHRFIERWTVDAVVTTRPFSTSLTMVEKIAWEQMYSVESLWRDGLVEQAEWDALRWRLWDVLHLSLPSRQSVGWPNLTQACRKLISDVQSRNA